MSNPFDPFGAPAPAPAPATAQYGMNPAQSPSAGSNYSYGSAAPAGYPAAGYPNAPSPQAAPPPAYGQQPGYSNAPAPQAAPPVYGHNQMVVSQQQSNPYGGVVAPDPMMQNQQSLVPATQPPQGQWGMQQQPAYPAPAPAGGAVFDPLATDPFQNQSLVPAHPSPPQAPPPGAPPQQPAYDEPFGALPTPSPVVQPPRASPPPEDVVKSQREAYEHPGKYGREGDYGPSETSSNRRDGDDSSRNPYSNQLARTVAGASSLPKAELVKKKGWVLSRISFRTILTKKWKQSYWVQYGSHTMLWFRSQQDFDDWLNNPYHNQAQRNFLIKLAVNFVHDLYKPNVRGYQVTQCRVKPYGNKMVRQFKLERWMDYGPTIAAAFGAYDPKEVDKLRAAIVECMKNTPLEGGVRATGAVKQHHEEQAAKRQEVEMRDRPQNGHLSGRETSAQSEFPVPASGSRSVASVDDLLDSHNTFDDASSYPNMPGYGGMPDPSQQAFAAYTQQSFGAPAPPAAAPPQPYGQPYPAPAASAPYPAAPAYAAQQQSPAQYGYGQPQTPQQYPQQNYGQF